MSVKAWLLMREMTSMMISKLRELYGSAIMMKILFFSYEGADVYGSDFRLMIATNNYLTGEENLHYLELNCRYNEPRESILESGNCDDGKSWSHETPGLFLGICVCHTTAIFCRDLDYRIQDILQLNDFWNEVHVRYQQFATQDKNYKYPRD